MPRFLAGTHDGRTNDHRWAPRRGPDYLPHMLLPLLVLAACGQPKAAGGCDSAVGAWGGRWFIEWARPNHWKPYLFTGPLDLVQNPQTCRWDASVDFHETQGGAVSASTVTVDETAAHFDFPMGGAHLLLDLFRDGDTLRGGARSIDDVKGTIIPWSVVDGVRQWPLIAPGAVTPWITASPEEVGLPSPAIRDLVDEAERTHSSGFILIKDDRIVALAGEDPMAPAHVASLSKALSSLAVPFLLAESRWKSIDEPLSDALTEWAAPDPRSAITLRHVLSHTSGLETPEYKTWIEGASQDHEKDVLSARLLNPPGTVFQYSNRAVELTSVLVDRLTQAPLDAYIRPRMLEPMGINATWWRDPRNHARVHAGVTINAIDLAKLGVLMRDGGKWNGKQLLPAGWVETAATAATSAHSSPGLGWFPMESGHAFQHSGDSGAVLLVVPDTGVVMARVHRPTRADENDRLPQHSVGRLMPMTLALKPSDKAAVTTTPRAQAGQPGSPP
jgi:CubicO group peptidase (beta-lactamase class C family)